MSVSSCQPLTVCCRPFYFEKRRVIEVFTIAVQIQVVLSTASTTHSWFVFARVAAISTNLVVVGALLTSTNPLFYRDLLILADVLMEVIYIVLGLMHDVTTMSIAEAMAVAGPGLFVSIRFARLRILPH